MHIQHIIKGGLSKLDQDVSLFKVDDQNSQDEINRSIKKVVDALQFKMNGDVKKVVIKPNLAYYWKTDTGYTTDPRVVASIIDYLREKLNPEIYVVESDASAMKTKYAFKMLDYEIMAKQKNVELFNLSDDYLESKTITVNNKEIKLKIPKILFESDLIINVPKMKTMSLTHITCAMKNIFGCIGEPRKIKYHKVINETIVGINKIVKPHLTIVDGLVVHGHSPKRLNLFMAGRDPFSVDCIAAKIMGYNPKRIKYLNLAQKEGWGNPNDVNVLGADWRFFQKSFPHVNDYILQLSNKLQFKLISLYARIVGDIIPPLLET